MTLKVWLAEGSGASDRDTGGEALKNLESDMNEKLKQINAEGYDVIHIVSTGSAVFDRGQGFYHCVCGVLIVGRPRLEA